MDSKALQPEPSKPSELRIVLVGKTGVGKSASGNAILRSDSFKVDMSSASVTNECKKMTREFGGQTVAVVDTPGLFHTSTDQLNQREEIKKILQCAMLISPGPHVFLFVMKLTSFSREDQETLSVYQKYFENAASHTIVLFTHGDGDEGECEDFIEKNKSLKKFMDEGDKKYHVFNSEDQDVDGLMQKIENVVQKNGGSWYSNEMFKKVENILEEEKEKAKTDSAAEPNDQSVRESMIEKFERVLEKIEIPLFGNVKELNKWLVDRVYDLLPKPNN